MRSSQVERPRLFSGSAIAVAILATVLCDISFAQPTREPDQTQYANETLQHFQALLRLNTSNPPGNEYLVTDYLKNVLAKEGIEARILALDPSRPNLVAR